MTRKATALRVFQIRLASLILSVALIVVGLPAFIAYAGPIPEGCEPQQAALDSVHQRIDAHNARPHVFKVPEQAAALEAYNAEAAQLESEQAAAITALDACLQKAQIRDQALKELLDQGPGSSATRARVPDSIRQALDSAGKNTPPNWNPPARVPGKSQIVEPNSPARPAYDALRGKTPGRLGDVTLQRLPRPKIGDPDPAFPGTKIAGRKTGEPDVSPDHIIPLAEVVNLPGFMRLNPDNMYAVANARLNLQWLSRLANQSKLSKSVADMAGVDKAWQASQVNLENRVRAQLQDIIKRLLASQE